jgi:hypothetical protein
MEWITFLTPYPFWIKLMLTLGVVCWVVAGIGMIFTPNATTKAAKNGGGDINITSHDQHGGITAHTVNDNKP